MPAALQQVPAGRSRRALTARLAVHALGWLTVGNAIGLLLATLLLAPRLNAALAPLTYGRWVPLHLDLQLYGWCALPLVGLLFRLYLPAADAGRAPALALDLWSGSLAFAAVGWLAGEASGKPFLDFAGAARWLLVANLAVLWGVLAVGWRRRAAQPAQAGAEGPALRTAKAAFLVLLAAVPPLLAWASGPGVYPAVNPDSGGATGGSLLGSTLAVVAILWAFPWIAGRPPRRDPAEARRVSGQTLAVLALHFAAFILLDHGDRSHHEALQVAALATLAIWPPLLVRHLRRFAWPRPLLAWLAALGGWGALLVASAFVTFLPGVLERWKFTDALVAHAHLAMAGMATALLVAVLASLDAGGEEDAGLGAALARPLPFALWHGGCLVYFVTMTAAGTLEGGDPALLFTTPPPLAALYAARWVAGAAMLTASASWLAGAYRHLAAVERRRPAAGAAVDATPPCRAATEIAA
jgi:cytochrome c oxidase cbb3-type subunit 1